MTKPRLGKVRALFYVFQQVMTGREMRVHQNFDTPSVKVAIACSSAFAQDINPVIGMTRFLFSIFNRMHTYLYSLRYL